MEIYPCKIFSALIFLVLLGYCKSVYAQDSTHDSLSKVHLYFGGSISIGGEGGANTSVSGGLGIEFGVCNKLFFNGFESGFYGVEISHYYENVFRPTNYVSPDYLASLEYYYGIHAGIILGKIFWIGADFLWSSAKIHHFTQTFSQTFFNVGPDLRIGFWEHWTLNLAFTIRRGLKLGASYVL